MRLSGPGAYTHIALRDEEGEIHLARRRTLYLPVLIAAAVEVSCAFALSVLSDKAEATFPGKNGRIAYESNGVIYTINPDGSGKTKVTGTSTAGYSVDYSPDGKKITYTEYEGNGTTAEIYTINVGGGAKTNVTNNNRDDQDSSYSPNGKRIAYAGFDGHDYELYTIGVHGKNRVQLTNNATNDYGPVYSPNGERIAASDGNRKAAEIYTIGVHGGGKSKVTEGITPSYSPDGKKIAYTGGLDGGTPRSTRSMSVEGAGPR